MTTRPLDGITVLDLTTALAGPYATLLLGGLGARIIKIENPHRGGDSSRTNSPYLTENGLSTSRMAADDMSVSMMLRGRNKESITLDLKRPEGVQLLRELIAKADVLVENFSAGVTTRLGIDYASVRELNERLVYTSITGFGSDTDAGKAMDTIVQALSGVMMTAGEPGDAPIRFGLPIGDLSAPLFAVTGTLAALLEVQRSGRGQHVDVSMLGALTSMVACEPFDAFEELGLPTRTGDWVPRLAPFGTFQASDGWFALCAPTDQFAAGVFTALDRPDLLADPRFRARDERVEKRRRAAPHHLRLGVDPEGDGCRGHLHRERRAGCPGAHDRRRGARSAGAASRRHRAARAPAVPHRRGVVGDGHPDPLQRQHRGARPSGPAPRRAHGGGARRPARLPDGADRGDAHRRHPVTGAAGAVRVGVVGRDVPLELIEAFGASPHRLAGDPHADRTEADRWLGRGIDPAANARLAGVLADGFAAVDAIAVANDSEASLRLYYALRELARTDPDAGVPPLHLLEVPHIPRPTSRDYARAEFARFGEVLTTWTGTPLDATELARAIESREAARAALAGRRAELPGSRFLELRLRLDRGPVDAVQRELDAVPAVTPSGRPRLVLSGSGHDHPGVTQAIESAGFDVVGDDHPDGELGLGARSSAPTLDALADRYCADGPTPHRSSPRERAEHLARLVDERRADGVLVYVRRFDDAPLWDVAAQRRGVAVPLVLLSGQEYGEIDAADLARAHADIQGAARV